MWCELEAVKDQCYAILSSTKSSSYFVLNYSYTFFLFEWFFFHRRFSSNAWFWENFKFSWKSGEKQSYYWKPLSPGKYLKSLASDFLVKYQTGSWFIHWIDDIWWGALNPANIFWTDIFEIRASHDTCDGPSIGELAFAVLVREVPVFVGQSFCRDHHQGWVQCSARPLLSRGWLPRSSDSCFEDLSLVVNVKNNHRISDCLFYGATPNWNCLAAGAKENTIQTSLCHFSEDASEAILNFLLVCTFNSKNRLMVWCHFGVLIKEHLKF